MNPPSYPVWDGAILVGWIFDVTFNNDGAADNPPSVEYDSSVLQVVVPATQIGVNQFKVTFKAIAPGVITTVTGTWTTKNGANTLTTGIGIPVRANPWATEGSISVLPGKANFVIDDTFTVTLEVNGEIDAGSVSFSTDEPQQPSQLLTFGPVTNPSPNVYTATATVKGAPGKCSILCSPSWLNGLYALYFRTQVLYFSTGWLDANSPISVGNVRF